KNFLLTKTHTYFLQCFYDHTLVEDDCSYLLPYCAPPLRYIHNKKTFHPKEGRKVTISVAPPLFTKNCTLELVTAMNRLLLLFVQRSCIKRDILKPILKNFHHSFSSLRK